MAVVLSQGSTTEGCIPSSVLQNAGLCRFVEQKASDSCWLLSEGCPQVLGTWACDRADHCPAAYFIKAERDRQTDRQANRQTEGYRDRDSKQDAFLCITVTQVSVLLVATGSAHAPEEGVAQTGIAGGMG